MVLTRFILVVSEPLHSNHNIPPAKAALLYEAFGERLQMIAPLARYTAARVGGPAAILLEVRSISELEQAVKLLWDEGLPFMILGGGSNVVISDAGVPGVVLVNRSRRVRFDEQVEPPTVWAESGANFGAVARQAAVRGLSGLEWAAGIPGTVGGAVVGNAGAHGGDMAGNLLVAEILHHARGKEQWPVKRLGFGYRSSVLKSHRPSEGEARPMPPQAVVLSALMCLGRSTPDTVQARIEELVAYRRVTQPPGASMGSMFKNPPGDYAGRLIEAAGLKGKRIGDAQISEMHANFFVNLGGASAADVYALIQTARREVQKQFGIELELEVELVGEWDVVSGK